MNEIILIAIALLVGAALGYLPRKSGPKEVADHSSCLKELDQARNDHAEDIYTSYSKHQAEMASTEAIKAQQMNELVQQHEAEKASLLKSAFPISEELRALINESVSLTKQQESIDSSGESKRHQVYAQLIKAHPEANRRDLAMAIEFAVRGI